MKRSSEKKAPAGRVAVMAMCSVLAGALLALGAMKVFPTFPLFDSAAGSRNTQVTNSITREEQVVLLSLGVEGISEKKGPAASFFGMDVPGSERASFLQYAFSAKLGLDGKDVKIASLGEKDYLITIPKFIFIGHDNESFKVVVEDNGVLSWATPEIDTAEMITRILSDEVEADYLSKNKEILQDQARAFYTGIITSIDPAVTVRFEFQ